MNLLHLDSSILGGHSVSRTLSAAVAAQIKRDHPVVTETYRDLAAEPIPHLSGSYLAAAQSPDGSHDGAASADLALGKTVLDEFLAADVVVIGVAFYNFSVSTQLKAWIDRIAIAGKTFRYSAEGVEGLAGDKRVILAIARGGFYGPGTPSQPFEHAESYLRAMFGFLGVTKLEVVAAEGIAIGPDQREAALKSALDQVSALPKAA